MAQFPDEQSKSGEFKRQEDAFRDWVKARRLHALPARARPLSSLRLARVSLGASHDHSAQTQRPRGNDRPDRRRPRARRARLGVPRSIWRDARRRVRERGRHRGRPSIDRSRERLPVLERSLPRHRSQLPRARHRPGFVGQADEAHRQQLRRRSSAHVQQRVRRLRDQPLRLLPTRPPRRNRPDQPARLRAREQRRLSRRLCHRPAALRTRREKIIRNARRTRRAPRGATLLVRPAHDRVRLAPFSRRSSGSTRSITATSNATSAALSIIRISGLICAISISTMASPRR